MYKAAVGARPNYDIVRVDAQHINWTLKELDVSVHRCLKWLLMRFDCAAVQFCLRVRPH